jgi:hypothetical protein
MFVTLSSPGSNPGPAATVFPAKLRSYGEARYTHTGLLDTNPLREDIIHGAHSFLLHVGQYVGVRVQLRRRCEVYSAIDNRLVFGFSKTASPSSVADFCKYVIEFSSRFPDYPKPGDDVAMMVLPLVSRTS